MSAHWQKIMLANIAEVAAGQGAPQSASDFDDFGTPFIRAGSLDALVKGSKESDCERVTADAARKYKLRLFEPGTVLFAKSGMSAKLDRIYQLKSPAYVVNHLATVMTTNKCDASFLMRWLQANPPSRLIKDDAYPSIRLSDIEEIEIPLPPLNEQRRIATILDKADAIRRKRQESIRLTEEFLRSTFLEMFGDPVTNPKGWEIKSLENEIAFMTSGSRGWANYYSNEGKKFIRIQNVKNGQLHFNDVQFVNPPNNKEAARTKVQENDLLISITADLGRTAVVDGTTANEGAHINQHLALVRLAKSLNPHFVAAYLESQGGKRQFMSLDQSAVKSGLNFDSIKSLQVVSPPLKMQEQYAAFVLSIQKTKAQLRIMESTTDTLFNSLTQRAFRGEL